MCFGLWVTKHMPPPLLNTLQYLTLTGEHCLAKNDLFCQSQNITKIKINPAFWMPEWEIIKFH